jgi:hypothetical protein
VEDFLQHFGIAQASTKTFPVIKSKIVTPKGPEAFRRDPNLRCAMKVGYPELGNLGATKSHQGKYEERKEREREKWGVYIGWWVHRESLGSPRNLLCHLLHVIAPVGLSLITPDTSSCHQPITLAQQPTTLARNQVNTRIHPPHEFC